MKKKKIDLSKLHHTNHTYKMTDMEAKGSDTVVNVILPVWGQPYICKNLSNNLKDSQEIVNGFVEWINKGFCKKHILIHPMFCEEGLRWRMAEKILQSKKHYKFICGEDAIRNECANMAVIYRGGTQNAPTPRPMHGICAIQIKKGYLQEIDEDKILPWRDFLCGGDTDSEEEED